MPGPAEQLIGRAAELRSLEGALASVEGGRPAALELVGEPGIGKTRLLAELGALADGRGHLVLSGAASEFERDLPFWVFEDALDEYVQSMAPARLGALEGEARAELAHVLPALPAGGEASLPASERYRTHRAVRRLLEVLAADKPLVLVLDDLHWADSGSIELVAALLRRPPGAAVLLAMAARPRQVPELLSAAFERAVRAGTLTRLEVGALSAQEARELLGTAVPDAVYAQTGGNPFYLEQIARADRANVSLADTLRAEIALLDGARRVLEGAAVAGDPFELELAAAAAGVDEPAAMTALDELLRRDLVRATDVPRRFRFRHPLVRQAVYEATPAGWRLAAHERSADALAARGAAAVVRAHHVEHAGRHGDTAAIAVLRAAGEAVAQRTPAGAARWFAAALRMLPDDAPPQERIQLLSSLAGALAATGGFAEARAALIESLAIAPRDDVALRTRLTSGCAAMEQLLGRHDDAHARLEAAVAELEGPASREAAALMVRLATACFYRTEHEASRAWAHRAVEVAEPLGERSTVAAALAVLALAGAMSGAVDEGGRYATQAAELVDVMPDDELSGRLEAIAHLAGAESYLDRFDEALAHAKRGLAVARATAQSELAPMLIPAATTVCMARGEIAFATELLDNGVEGARLAGNAQSLSWVLFNRAIFAQYAGDLDLARAFAEEAVDLAQGFDAGVVRAYASTVLAVVLIGSGDAERGVPLLMEAAGGPGLPIVPGGWRAYYLQELTTGLLALGRVEEARRAAQEADAVAVGVGLRHAVALAHRAAARVMLHEGDARGAAERAFASAFAAEAVGARLEVALSRALAGRALAVAGDEDGAAQELERAATTFEALGARRHHQEAESELRRLGRRRPRRTRAGKAGATGIESLTERELQVARLVVDRRTNPEIAAELFLSQKTVESHIRNLFNKLGVSSRVEIARTVERAERTPIAH